LLVLIVFQPKLTAQQLLGLEQCKQMALDSNKELEQARQKLVMSDYDRKIALANYFPNISATGTYLYNSKDISLVSAEQSTFLNNIGTGVQSKLSGSMQDIMAGIMQNPDAIKEYMTSPIWQTILGRLSQADVSAALNEIGSGIDEALHFDVSNIYAGIISIQQPIFMGGKIVASNRIASLARDLSETEYDGKCSEIEQNVEHAYWQIVSIAAKNRLALSYLELLEQMEKDAEVSVAEGVAVQADLLAIKIKRNEARMLLTKTQNGLALSKMLLCRQIGLPLDSEVKLLDEEVEIVPKADFVEKRDIARICGERTETRMLELATKIYDKKVAVVRADYLPKVALTANYLVSNPNLFSGFNDSFSGMYNVGIAVGIPIFHATEGLQKTKKAKAEARMYEMKYQDACDMVNLQVEQLFRQQQEAMDKLEMTETNLECAQENLRTAMLGFSEGVISSDTALQAQTAWLQANTENIDAGIELQLAHSDLLKAQAQY